MISKQNRHHVFVSRLGLNPLESVVEPFSAKYRQAFAVGLHRNRQLRSLTGGQPEPEAVLEMVIRLNRVLGTIRDLEKDVALLATSEMS